MHHSGEAKNREGRTTRGGFELGGLSRKQLRVVRFVERKHSMFVSTGDSTVSVRDIGDDKEDRRTRFSE